MKPKFDVEFDYDDKADVLYISLGTGEPSYCEEVDDLLLVERGYFSHQITGFRVLDVKHHKIRSVELGVLIKRAFKEEKKDLEKQLDSRVQVVPELINKRMKKDPLFESLVYK